MFRQRTYTQWDDTDAIKRMKDSDILAERRKSGTLGDTVSKMGMGAGIGMGIGSVIGGLSGMKKGGKGFMAGATSGAKVGAIIGGGSLGAVAAVQNSGKQQEIDFYNRRLGYAKRQAARRERMDWNQNMTQREGYTY